MCYGRLSGKRVLVVEDEPLIAIDLEYSLIAAGATVTVASSREDALRQASSRRFDGAILDLIISGNECTPVIDVCQALAVPFVIYTGSRPSECSDRGAPIIQKPAATEVVAQAFEDLIGTRPLGAASLNPLDTMARAADDR